MTTTMPFAQREETSLQLAGPLYLQVAVHLRRRIDAGEWSAQQPLPNEADLATSYKVSLGTMRKAMEMLARQRLVIRQQGRGTFVTKSQSQTDKRYWPLSLEAENTSTNPAGTSVMIRSRDKTAATAEEALLLNVSAGSPIVAIECITKIGSIAVSFDTLLVPAAVSPQLAATQWDGSDRVPESIETLMAEVIYCSDRLVPSLAKEDEARLLSITTGEPILYIERQAFNSSDRLIFAVKRRVALRAKTRYSMSLQ